MTEFRIAHQLVAQGRKKFLIPLLYEEVDQVELDADLALYIKTYTYTDCKDVVSTRGQTPFNVLNMPWPL